MTLREKLLFNGTTICIVPTLERREPVVLCEGKICEIQRYIGVHCNPRTRDSSSCWQFCLIVEAPETTNTFKKKILEKENSTLLIKLQPYSDGSILTKLIDVCFSMRTKPLIDIRSRVMLDTNMFVYDSMRRFMQGIRHFDCSSYRIILEDSSLLR